MTVGIDTPKPEKDCGDINCPFHGTLRVRGTTFTGTVVSSKVPKSAIVSWERRWLVRKYERFEVRRSKVAVHKPMCLGIKEGDTVLIAECRPISKTKKFVIIKKLESAIESAVTKQTKEAKKKEHKKETVKKE